MSQVAVAALERKNARKLTLLDRVSGFSLKIFGQSAGKIVKSMPGLRGDILKSNLRTTPEALVSLSLLITTITGVVAAAAVVLAFLLHFLLLSLAVVAIPISFAVSLNAPRFSQSGRSYALENELPYLVGYIEVLASGGVSPISTLRRVATMSKLMPASSKEAKRILVDIDVFGADPISALEKAANHNPNKTFSEFLYGYTTVLRTGGNAQTYVNAKEKDIMDERSTKLRRTSDSVGTLAEAYITVTAVLGISLFTLYQVESIVNHSNAGITSILEFAFLVVPIISVVFVYILDGMGNKQPYMDMRPYKAFGVCAPIGAALYLVPLPLPLFMHASIALIATVLVPAFLAMKYSRQKHGLEARLPDFIRDVAESRKIGLAPETGIEQLGSKNYGRLSSPVKKMGAQLSWGLSLSGVVSTFVNSVNSWLTKVVGSLMLEVVDVGGGTVRSFSEMADFTRKINDLEAEKRSMLRPYIFVIYTAGLLIVLTTFVMVYFLAATPMLPGAPRLTAPVDPNTVEMLLVSAIFQGWVVGLVAGKMGEGSVSDGFKHSLLLVFMSAMTVYIASFFIKMPL